MRCLSFLSINSVQRQYHWPGRWPGCLRGRPKGYAGTVLFFAALAVLADPGASFNNWKN
jgi:hypothetical protein